MIVGVVVFTVPVVIYRSKLKRQFEDIRERLCGRLAIAETETGNGPSAQAIYSPVTSH